MAKGGYIGIQQALTPCKSLGIHAQGCATLTAALIAFGIVCIIVCTSTRPERMDSKRSPALSGASVLRRSGEEV